MKKIILLLIMLIFTASLSANEPIIKFYLSDGTSNSIKLNDIDNIYFIKSNISFSMLIFIKNSDSPVINEIKQIDSMKFFNNSLLKIYKSTEVLSYNIIEIDSIIFRPNICSEIQIGDQIWMCKNLDVDHYRNGDSIPQVTDPVEWTSLKTGAWCYYNNNPAMGAIYGKLYNWYAVNDPRGLAPEGWQIPPINAWDDLANYLGGYDIAARQIKEQGYEHWQFPNTGTNETGFTALPGGYYNEGLGLYGYWWTSSESEESYYYYLRAETWNDILFKNVSDKNFFYSVRCIKEDINDTMPAPYIVSIYPETSYTGQIMTIKGKNFGNKQNSGYVYFGYVKVSEFVSWSDTIIKLKIPSTTANRFTKIKVYRNYSKFSNEALFCPGKCVSPPNNIYATSIDETTIRIRWDVADNEYTPYFSHYVVSVWDNNEQIGVDEIVDKSSKIFTKTGLIAGKVYTFKVKSVYIHTISDNITINWSPAYRYHGVKIFETNSESGCGLVLDPVNGPNVRTIIDASIWDIALDTKSEVYDIGSPSLLSYPITNPKNTFIWAPQKYIARTNLSSLDDIYDTEMLQPSQESTINFNDRNTSFLFAVKTQDGYYAKIFVKANNGVLLQGTKPNRYIEVDISLQKIKNVPYAH